MSDGDEGLKLLGEELNRLKVPLVRYLGGLSDSNLPQELEEGQRWAQLVVDDLSHRLSVLLVPWSRPWKR